MKKLQDLSTQTLIKVNKHLLSLIRFLNAYSGNRFSSNSLILVYKSEKIESELFSRRVFLDLYGNLIYNKQY